MARAANKKDHPDEVFDDEFMRLLSYFNFNDFRNNNELIFKSKFQDTDCELFYKASMKDDTQIILKYGVIENGDQCEDNYYSRELYLEFKDRKIKIVNFRFIG